MYPGLDRRRLIGSGALRSPLALAPSSYHEADAGVYADGACQFTAANKEYLTVADNAGLSQSGATGVIEVGGWFYLDSVGVLRPLIVKGDVSNLTTAFEYGLYYDHTGTNFKFTVGSGSASTTVVDTDAAPSVSTWYFLRAGRKADGTLYISRNNGAEVTEASAVAIQDSDNAFMIGGCTGLAYFHNGRADSCYMTKTASSAAIATALYNAGAGRVDTDCVAANGLDVFWANVISWWNMNSGDDEVRYDKKGTNHLTPAAVQLINATTLNGGFETAGLDGGQKSPVMSATRARTSNVATITTTLAHGYVNGNVATVITGFTDTTFNGTNKTITRIDDNTFTYPSTGDDVVAGADTGGKFSTDVLANWVENAGRGISYLKRNTTSPYAGSSDLLVSMDVSGYGAWLTQASLLTVGKRYKATCYAKKAAGNIILGLGQAAEQVTVTTTDYTVYTKYFTATSATAYIGVPNGLVSGVSGYVDNFTLESLGPDSAAGIAAGVATDGNFCGQFNGTSQSLSIADASQVGLDPGTSDYSYSLWVNGDLIDANSRRLLVKGAEADAAAGYLCTWYNGTVVAYHHDGTGSRLTAATAASSVYAGRWYHVVVTHDRDGNMSLYLNAASPVTTAISAQAGAVDSANAFTLAKNSASSANFFPGRLDNVRFWTRCLSAAEVTALFSGGIGLKYGGLTAALKVGLVSAYDMDKKDGLTADSHGPNTLTNNGTVTYGTGVGYYEGVVASILDQSGNLKTLSQTTPSKRPSWQAGVLNGSPGLYFDGVDDILVRNEDILGTGDVTIIAVFKPISWSTAVSGRIIQNGTEKFQFRLSGTNSNLLVSSDGVSVITSANNSISLGAAYVAVVTRKASGAVTFYINGALSGAEDQASGTPSGYSAVTNVGNRTLGERAFDGYIFEVGIVQRILNGAEISAVSRSLGSKYGITVS